MWFIFPQLDGLVLNPSSISQRYAIASLAEAEAYVQHLILGPRLRECSALLLDVENESIEAIMGYPDNLKLKSSMTLFSRATADNSVFLAVLEKYLDGELDAATLRLLSRQDG